MAARKLLADSEFPAKHGKVRIELQDDENRGEDNVPAGLIVIQQMAAVEGEENDAICLTFAEFEFLCRQGGQMKDALFGLTPAAVTTRYYRRRDRSRPEESADQSV